MKTMTIRAYFCLLVTLLLSTGCTKNFEVEEADKMQEFYISQPYFKVGPEYMTKLTVTGKIDGRARIYMTHSTTVYDPFYSLSFGPLDLEKTISRQIGEGYHLVIYKPITAKKGKLNIKVEF